MSNSNIFVSVIFFVQLPHLFLSIAGLCQSLFLSETKSSVAQLISLQLTLPTSKTEGRKEHRSQPEFHFNPTCLKSETLWAPWEPVRKEMYLVSLIHLNISFGEAFKLEYSFSIDWHLFRLDSGAAYSIATSQLQCPGFMSHPEFESLCVAFHIFSLMAFFTKHADKMDELC